MKKIEISGKKLYKVKKKKIVKNTYFKACSAHKTNLLVCWLLYLPPSLYTQKYENWKLRNATQETGLVPKQLHKITINISVKGENIYA